MEILRWIQWQWRQWEFWQKTFIVAMFFVGAAVTAPAPIDKYLFGISAVIVFSYTFKWFIIEPIRDSYSKYKRQRDGLFNTIKGE